MGPELTGNYDELIKSWRNVFNLEQAHGREMHGRGRTNGIMDGHYAVTHTTCEKNATHHGEMETGTAVPGNISLREGIRARHTTCLR